MSDKFKNKYTIKSSRLQNYDYTQNGMYFVTICTKDKECFLGEIKNDEMVLSNAGKIVEQFWQEIPKHFPFVNLDAYQIMPNHVHGIIEIVKNDSVEARFIATEGVINDGFNNVTMQQSASPTPTHSSDAINRVSTVGNVIHGGITGENNPMLNPFSLSKIIRWYKGRCAFEIKKQLNPITFSWQSRFYDHIIRNEISLNEIREYIMNNPIMWERDRNLPGGEADNLENLFV